MGISLYRIGGCDVTEASISLAGVCTGAGLKGSCRRSTSALGPMRRSTSSSVLLVRSRGSLIRLFSGGGADSEMSEAKGGRGLSVGGMRGAGGGMIGGMSTGAEARGVAPTGLPSTVMLPPSLFCCFC